jgi:hypothetical protein
LQLPPCISVRFLSRTTSLSRRSTTMSTHERKASVREFYGKSSSPSEQKNEAFCSLSIC